MSRPRALSALPRTRIQVSREQAPEAAAIEQDFPEWHVWISNLGRWWAVRQGPDATHSRDDRRPMTIDADDPGTLRTQLATYRDPSP